jgi:hypothetical protein
MTTRRLFLSMVSDEFRACRQLLAQDLERSRVEVCTQEKFGNLGATTLHKLDAYLKDCDAVIHVVGDGLGHVPPPAAVDALLAQHPSLLPMLADHTGLTRAQLGRCSYTQWEAYLALFHKLRLHIYRPDARAPREAGFVADPAGQSLQAAHFERIRQLGRDRDVFLNEERLSSYVLADLNDLLPGRDSSVAVAATRLSHSATRLRPRGRTRAARRGMERRPHESGRHPRQRRRGQDVSGRRVDGRAGPQGLARRRARARLVLLLAGHPRSRRGHRRLLR